MEYTVQQLVRELLMFPEGSPVIAYEDGAPLVDLQISSTGEVEMCFDDSPGE